MVPLALFLMILSGLSLLLTFFIRRWRTFLILTTFFAILNSYIVAPLNWSSLLSGHPFLLKPITPTHPPVPLERLALPTDAPEAIIDKMGCFVCHKIPLIPKSRSSSVGPVLIAKTTAILQLKSKEYQDQIKSGHAAATTQREYIIESILKPDAFIVPGYEDQQHPENSLMYPHYDKRFTRGGLKVLVDFLLSLDVYSAMQDGMVVGH